MREWKAGGDRVAYWDTRNYRASETVRAHLIVSHSARRVERRISRGKSGGLMAHPALRARPALPSRGELAEPL